MKSWLYQQIFLRAIRPILHRLGIDLVAFNPPIDKKAIYKAVEPVLKRIAAWRPSKIPTSGEQTIWQFWWQGKDNAPPLVKRCMESVRRHSRGWQVVVIDEQNLSQYVDIPSFIAEKHRSGIISHTHFSDYLRAKLLQTHGGVWIDATVLLTEDISEQILKAKTFAFKTSLWASVDDIPSAESFLGVVRTADNTRIGGGGNACSSWFLAACRDSALMSVVAQALEWYWESATELVDYFLFHFLLSYAVAANEACRKEFVAMPMKINLKPHMLLFKLTEPFEADQWRILRETSPVHKLSYKGNDFCNARGTFLEALLTGRLAEP